jgi:YhcH/YjgK/YiaL family protein
MVIDTLEHADSYAALLPGLDLALAFLRRSDLATLPDGRHEIDGDRVYALLQSYDTRPPAPGKLETHRRYADVQVLLRGRELCGWAAWSDQLRVTAPYDAARDIMFCDGACDFVTLNPGLFALLLPQDAHLPCCQADGQPSAVRKAVIKIRLT